MKIILIKIVFVFFLVEAVIMFFLWLLPSGISGFYEILLDAFLLSIFYAPVIYLWIIRPYVFAQKKAEEEIKKSQKDLEQRVQERTEDFLKMSSEIKRIYFEKTEFLSQISHELRTPLNGILGFSQLLEKDTSLKKENKDLVKHILTSGNHLLAIINDVLNLSRVETGRIDLNLEIFDSRDVIKECLVLIDSPAKEKDLQVCLEISGDGNGFVYCDRRRLKEVLLNLLTNAVKYNQSNGKILVIQKMDNGRVQMIVEDNGETIPEEKRINLFKPFRRLGKEYSNIEGSGIGLALSKRLVEIMNGNISYEAIENGGNRFFIEFDLLKDISFAAFQEKEPHPHLQKHDSAEIQTVLILGYQPAVIQFLENTIQKYDSLKPLSAMEAVHAVQLLKYRVPCMVFVDTDMPELEVQIMIKELRVSEEWKNLPIIAMGFLYEESNQEELRQSGYTDYLRKPLREEDVNNIVRKYTAVNISLE